MRGVGLGEVVSGAVAPVGGFATQPPVDPVAELVRGVAGFCAVAEGAASGNVGGVAGAIVAVAAGRGTVAGP
jgi:hypothetical protein